MRWAEGSVKEGGGGGEVDEGPVCEEKRQASVSLFLIIVGLFHGLLGIFCGTTGLSLSLGVTHKRRCTYRPSVIYLIVNKLLSLSLSLSLSLALALALSRALSRVYIYTHMVTPGRRETNDGRGHISNTLATH